ncbi:hypothetical protein IMG5_145120 [Ichthyophthirius multifiliis]|uniref:Uncharacterized protein n=1 Tax=Ichthyophthirius multifiliis TaxID=5932 RepID=G0QXT2_ICHMU|nr:hypothetical protein IMG5_145120 [Ichthyophthirius multifiliis]EGR29963.1 hypothetical protein IMG5_145120 [Ichthyophthirius multifiliis]|eukprot:XP_004031199.1 hypothetical protein IMG5_145120 [Ichthyophthirius multifiliis]
MKSKNIEVKREDLIDQITLCGLKLEKIIAFLAKKKDSLRVESINTDAENFQPPDYVGINPIDYTRPKEIEDMQNFQESVFFDYVENDPNDVKEEEFIKTKRDKIKIGIVDNNE